MSTPSPDKNIIGVVKQKGDEVTRRILELLVGAFTLVTALTWNDAVKSLFAETGIFYRQGRWGPWINAVFITIFVYCATMWLKNYITSPCTTMCTASIDSLASALAAKQTAATTAPQTRRPAVSRLPKACTRW